MYTQKELQTWTRQSIIDWLVRNDPNGVYTDDDSIREFGEVMCKEEGIQLILKQQKG